MICGSYVLLTSYSSHYGLSVAFRQGGLENKSLVLQTPHRTFSFIMSNQLQRDTFGYCILYLLKIKNRGVMAASSSPAVKASQGPKSGMGKVVYPNRSSYEGQSGSSASILSIMQNA